MNRLVVSYCKIILVIYTIATFCSCTIIKNPRSEKYIARHTINTDRPLYKNQPQKKALQSELSKAKFAKVKNFILFKLKSYPRSIDTNKLSEDLVKVKRAFYSNGYLDAKVTTSLGNTFWSRNRKQVVYDVALGPLYLMSDIGGYFGTKDRNKIFNDFAHKKNFLQPLSIFNYDELNQTLVAIQNEMSIHGYPRLNKDMINVLIDTSNLYLDLKHARRLSKIPHHSFQLYFSLDSKAPKNVYNRYKVDRVLVNTLTATSTNAFKQIDSDLWYQDVKGSISPKFIRRQVPKDIAGDDYSALDVNYINSNLRNARSFSLVTQFSDYKTDSTLDMYFELTPRKKMSIGLHSDLSYNDGAQILVGAAQSQLLDISLAAEFNINNLFKQSVQYTFFVRGGIQLNPNQMFKFSSQSINLSNILRIPGFWLSGFYLSSSKRLYAKSTNFVVDLMYFNRELLFTLVNLRLSNSFSWSYKGFNFNFTPLNLEFYDFNSQPAFDEYLEGTFREVQNAYRNGKLVSAMFSVFKRWQITPSFSLSTYIGVEETGLYGGLYNTISNTDDVPFFFRNEVNIRMEKILSPKNRFAFRLYYGNNIYYQPNQSTPYFRKLFAGGTASMRAWQNRGLGFGSIPQSFSDLFANDKLGDLKLETNIEYRFNIFRIDAFQVEGALFMDIGNIWYKEGELAKRDERGKFFLPRLVDDVAMAGGVGARFKIGFFTICLDWAYKLKDPQATNKFRLDQNIMDGTLQIGVGYPF